MGIKTVSDISAPGSTPAKQEEAIWWFIGSQLYELERKGRVNNLENEDKLYPR
jgi:hypothetical protein